MPYCKLCGKQITIVEKDPTRAKLLLDPKLISTWIYSPEQNQFISVRGRAAFPGVEVHATVLSNLILQRLSE